MLDDDVEQAKVLPTDAQAALCTHAPSLDDISGPAGPISALSGSNGSNISYIWEVFSRHIPTPVELEDLRRRFPTTEKLRENKGTLHEGLKDELSARLASFRTSVTNLTYPESAYAGRGVVTTGGSHKYWPLAVVMLASLRRTGCTLPAELWLLPNEIDQLPRRVWRLFEHVLGCAVRVLPTPGGLHLTGYQSKVMAIMSSRFREVLYLDADNTAVTDPTDLFETSQYTSTGALFWKDFWQPSYVAALYEITNLI